jgi:hypothetical protein
VNQFAAQFRETLRRPRRALNLLNAETRRAFFAQHKLSSFVRAAWATGRSFDLTGVGYGRKQWGDTTRITTKTPPYYWFLAGVSAEMEAVNVIEIGTHWDGSSVALMRGMLSRHPAPLLVTIDVSTESDNYLPAQPEFRFIKKVLGDANDLKTVEQVRAQVQKADLLFIDARHWAEFTLLNTFLYGMLFRPRVILLDDVALNDSMRAAWAVLQTIYPYQSVDCKTIVPDIRPQQGFGLIALDRL